VEEEIAASYTLQAAGKYRLQVSGYGAESLQIPFQHETCNLSLFLPAPATKPALLCFGG
jgi:hypothetical protein